MLRDSANSQEMELEWASLWKAKCKEFHKKMLRDSAKSQEMELE